VRMVEHAGSSVKELAEVAKSAYKVHRVGTKMGREGKYTLIKTLTEKNEYSVDISQSEYGEIVVSFRGTSNIKEWMSNADLTETEAGFVPGKIHNGWKKLYMKVREEINETLREKGVLNEEGGATSPVVFTGHSLGGALATIALADWQHRGVSEAGTLSATTFGAPSPGNAEFNKNIGEGQLLRVVNKGDPVPTLFQDLQALASKGTFGSSDMAFDYEQPGMTEDRVQSDDSWAMFALDHAEEIIQLKDAASATGTMKNFIYWLEEKGGKLLHLEHTPEELREGQDLFWAGMEQIEKEGKEKSTIQEKIMIEFARKSYGSIVLHNATAYNDGVVQHRSSIEEPAWRVAMFNYRNQAMEAGTFEGEAVDEWKDRFTAYMHEYEESRGIEFETPSIWDSLEVLDTKAIEAQMRADAGYIVDAEGEYGTFFRG